MTSVKEMEMSNAFFPVISKKVYGTFKASKLINGWFKLKHTLVPGGPAGPAGPRGPVSPAGPEFPGGPASPVPGLSD